MAESDTILKKALFEAGVIEKDYLDNYGLAKRTLLRLHDNYPEFQPMDELLYHLYLMEPLGNWSSDYFPLRPVRGWMYTYPKLSEIIKNTNI
jgi:hypothetical protein